MDFVPRFVPWSAVVEQFRGKRVAIVGSAPSVLDNEPGFIDAHDVVVRINNYKLGPHAGTRTDVHYSFFGNSIRKTRIELERDGVKLCMCKCPDSKPMSSPWHEANGMQAGVDFRYIYAYRRSFWPCDVYVPDDARFMKKFYLLDWHIPTTGFSAILDVLDCEPAELFITGFDFFESGLHNVNEPWRLKNPQDPIGHRPGLEKEWLRQNLLNYPIQLDQALQPALNDRPQPTMPL